MLFNGCTTSPYRGMSFALMDERSEFAERLDAACQYALGGHPVFPVWWVVNGVCACGTDCGRDAGKHPITKNGKDDATTNIDQIFKWWLKYPLANIGVRCDYVIVFDVDPRHGGDVTLRQYQAEHGGLPATVHQRSGNGWHMVYDAGGIDLSQFKNTGRGGIDLKVDSRGYFIAATSLHANPFTPSTVTTR